MLYFVAIIPGEPLYGNLKKMKTDISQKYDTRRALNSPPHITLLAPFRMKDEMVDEGIEIISKAVQGKSSFDAELKDFSHFGNRTVFIGVEKSEPLVELRNVLDEAARKAGELFNYNYKFRQFNPHLTLASRDLSPANFDLLWEELEEKKYSASFTAGQVSLLRHDGKVWERLRDFKLD